MKKLCSCISAFIFILSLACPACASNTQTSNEESVNSIQANKAILTQRGFPSDFLEALNETELQQYAEDETIFYGGSKTCYYAFDKDGQAVLVGTRSGTDISPQGQIPSADLSLTMSHSFSTSGGNVSWINMVFKYDWKTMPFWRLQDPIGISFNPNLVQIKNGSFSKIDRYVASGYTGTKSNEPAAAAYSSQGVGWYADLYELKNTTRLFGQASFKLEPIPGTTIKRGTGWKTRLYAKYAHALGNISANFGFSYLNGTAGINLSNSSNTDELGMMYDITF